MEYFQEAISETTRSIGFRCHSKNISDLVRAVAENCEAFVLLAEIGGAA